MTLPVGIVLIGRNEGARLIAALDTVVELGLPFVYVDSGSTDGSIDAAIARGGGVVQLDLSRPFTAARARNEGFSALLGSHASLLYVQFVDGDCTLAPGWLAAGLEHIGQNDRVAVVCGRRRERYPERSIYNRICDSEWDGPVGEIDECGGDALVRVQAFRDVGGYDPGLIAGEEPDMCVRLRRASWKIVRLPVEMTLHDANVTRFAQWWKRTIRNGYAYGEVGWRYRSDQTPLWRKQVKSALVWGCVVPLVILAAAAVLGPVWLALFLVYPLQVARIVMRGGGSRSTPSYAAFVMLAKIPEAIGILRFHQNRVLQRTSQIIEYK